MLPLPPTRFPAFVDRYVSRGGRRRGNSGGGHSADVMALTAQSGSAARLSVRRGVLCGAAQRLSGSAAQRRGAATRLSGAARRAGTAGGAMSGATQTRAGDHFPLWPHIALRQCERGRGRGRRRCGGGCGMPQRRACISASVLLWAGERVRPCLRRLRLFRLFPGPGVAFGNVLIHAQSCNPGGN